MSSGGFAYDEPDDSPSSSPWLSAPGWYHVMIMEQDPAPKSRANMPLDALAIKIGVLEGSNKTQLNKTSDQKIFRGKPTDSDGGKFRNSRLRKLFEVTGVRDPNNPGHIDTTLLVQRQFVCEIEARPDDRNASIVRYEIKGAQIFHVDDPAVAHVPLNKEAIELIPKELRRSASSFLLTGQPASTPAPVQQPKVNDVMSLLNSQRPASQPVVDPSSV